MDIAIKLGSLSDKELSTMTKEFLVLEEEGKFPDDSKVVEYARSLGIPFDKAIRKIKDEAMFRWTMQFVK